MYDVLEIQNTLIEESDLIPTILVELDYDNIRDRGKYFQFPNHGGDNMAACSILKSTLQYQNFSHGGSGNIFTLVMDEMNCNFPKALELISQWTGIEISDKKQKIKRLPFGGFYKDVYKNKESPLKQTKIYNENELPPPDSISYVWAKDGASLISQEKFGIRYSHEDNAVLIPIYNLTNQLIGCKSRSMEKDIDQSKRFYAYLPYSKSSVLYGLNVNYKSIIDKKTLVIFESEKSVLQCDSFGFNYAVGIAGHDISKTQEKLIKSLMLDKIIVAFDEGICEEEIIFNCEKLKSDNKILKSKIGYIYDRENKYLKKGSKNSPSDLGYKKFKEVMCKCVTWL